MGRKVHMREFLPLSRCKKATILRAYIAYTKGLIDNEQDGTSFACVFDNGENLR